MVTKSAVVLLAEGAEEMEFAISVDILRRAGVSYFHVNIVIISFFMIGFVLLFPRSQGSLF
jgi:hypothetical protein